MSDVVTVVAAGRRGELRPHSRRRMQLGETLVMLGQVVALIDEFCPICVLVERDGEMVPMPIDMPQRPESPIHVRITDAGGCCTADCDHVRQLVLTGQDCTDADPVVEGILRRIARPEEDEGEVAYVTGMGGPRG